MKVETNVRFFFYRYAMTVWYFDAEERAEAKKKFRNLTGMTLKNVHLKYQIALNFFFFHFPPKAETDWE